MINRFRVVIPNKLYRGSAPSPKDVKQLKEKLGIKKIVSLDHIAGERIDRTCKLLNIQHIKMYITNDRKSLLRFISQDLRKLFLEGGPTFTHCHWGKDRTGLAIALVECKYLDKSPNKAIAEAKSLGFGIGLPKEIVNLYEKIIRSCKKSKNDENNANIVSNEREYKGDNRDSFLDEGHQGSFAPFLDGGLRQYPYDSVYNYINDQSPTRNNYALKEDSISSNEKATVPQVGEYDNAAGLYGAGPCFPTGGFISD